MEVCFCAHRLPYPPIAGGRIETYEMIAGLVDRGHSVTLVTYGSDEEAAAEMEATSGCTVRLVPGVPDRTLGNLTRNLVSRDPLPVMKARTPEYTETVRRAAQDADVVHLHALQPSYLARELPDPTPTVIRFNNVKYEIYRQFAKYTDNPGKAAYAYLQFLKTRRYEAKIADQATVSLTISPEDRDRLREVGSEGTIRVVPPGVDLERFAPDGTDEPGDTITFFGSMDYHPNEDAVRWFGREIFPEISRRYPEATFEIVGKNPSDRIERLGEQRGITVTGFVEDIREYIRRATVIVIPIRVGTGVRIKVLHAMAMGKPTVTTTVGKQGIGFEDGIHGLVADTASAFVDAVSELIADPEAREQYGAQARALMEREHDWATITERLEAEYRRILR